MGRKKASAAAVSEDGTVAEVADATPKRVVVRAKDRGAWDNLLRVAQEQAWRRLRITIKIRDKFLAGKPASLNAAEAMLKARGLEDFVAEAEDVTDPAQRAAMASDVGKNAGRCEFTRRNGIPGLWVPSNNFKAGFKENWSVLGLRVAVRGSRGALAEGVFVAGEEHSDWIRVSERDEPDGEYVGVAHTTGPSGPQSSIKRHEYVLQPTITFVVMIANATSVADKVSDDDLAKVLVHYKEHGCGACRSQGFGRFDVISVEEIEGVADPVGA